MTNASGFSLLDNPIWSSLTTGHARFAVGTGAARRYHSDIGPLAGLREPSAETFAELAALVPAGDVAVLEASSLRSILDVLEPAAVRAGTIDGLRFLPHRVSAAVIADYRGTLPGAAIGARPPSSLTPRAATIAC